MILNTKNPPSVRVLTIQRFKKKHWRIDISMHIFRSYYENFDGKLPTWNKSKNIRSDQ